MVYERLLKPLLFKLDAEEAHERVSRMLAAVGEVPGGAAVLRLAVGRPPRSLATKAFGLEFPNPIGLAAGFDKDGLLTGILPSLGFGFLEVGSVTLEPQPGNAKPRLFREPESRALINRMGFNSKGAKAVWTNLSRSNCPVPLGVNLGLNKDCPHEEAPLRYAATFKLLRDHGDYFAVNVSSPNTTGLRNLQEKRRLELILEAIRDQNPSRKPVLVKIAPDLTDAQLDDILDVVSRWGDGIIATNTTVTRPGVSADVASQAGGLSGAPLRELSLSIIRKIRARGKMPVIGAGGIFSGADALEKLMAGACLVQVYTSLVYRGPAGIVSIVRELEAELRARGFSSLEDAVDLEARL
jgi:dihydroorotate dehydrogenase